MNPENQHLQYDRAGLDLTEHSESDGGPRLVAFWDPTGKLWTCGYGHTHDVTANTTCTPELADQWLLSDVAEAVYAVKMYVTVPLTQDEFDALVDFVFNVGSGNFLHSTMLALINSKDYMGAMHEFQKWNKSGGQVLAGLKSRRAAEAALFLLGINFQLQNPAA